MAASTGVTQSTSTSPTSVLEIAFGPDKAAEVVAHVRQCFGAAYDASDLFGAAINAARDAELQAVRLFRIAHEQKRIAVTLGVLPEHEPGRLPDWDMPTMTYTLGEYLNAAQYPGKVAPLRKGSESEQPIVMPEPVTEPAVTFNITFEGGTWASGGPEKAAQEISALLRKQSGKR